MSLDLLFADTTDNYYYLARFKEGDEKAMDYFYQHAYRPLVGFGKRIIDDEFTVSTLVHEAILKTWDFRERMESMHHIYCFARLCVKWECYGWYRKPANRIYRQTDMDEFIEFRPDRSFFDDGATAYEHGVDEENLKMIHDVLPYLPAKRRTMLMLYFKYGLGYNEIANRFATSNQKISVEVQKGLEYLKKVIHAKKRITPDDKMLKAEPRSKSAALSGYEEYLSGETLQVFRLRYEMKLSFDAIAFRLGLPPGQVRQEYVTAHINLRKMKTN